MLVSADYNSGVAVDEVSYIILKGYEMACGKKGCGAKKTVAKKAVAKKKTKK